MGIRSASCRCTRRWRHRPGAHLPVLLDTGTDNAGLVDDPLYLGWRHRRIDGARYDDFLDRFVQAVHAELPGVLLQWEDFATPHALPVAGALPRPAAQLQR